jgi:TIR domain
MSDIFISYKREEQPVARKLANALESEGWTVWWDPKLRAGEHFDDVIEKALNEAKCVIVLWSERSVQSRYVRDEATYALEKDKLVPVAIENVDLPFRFRGVETLRLLDWDGSKDSSDFRRLVEDISAIFGPSHTVAAEAKRKADEEKERNRAQQEAEQLPPKGQPSIRQLEKRPRKPRPPAAKHAAPVTEPGNVFDLKALVEVVGSAFGTVNVKFGPCATTPEWKLGSPFIIELTNRRYPLFLDGNPIGDLDSEKWTQFTVSAGLHTLQARRGIIDSRTIDLVSEVVPFELKGGESIRFTVEIIKDPVGRTGLVIKPVLRGSLI